MSLETPAPDTPPEGLSRRHLMRQAAAVGAAGLAASLVTGSAPASAAPAAPTTADIADTADTAEDELPAHDEPMIVHVRDIRSGHLDLYRGEHHHRIQDPQLAMALARALA